MEQFRKQLEDLLEYLPTVDEVTGLSQSRIRTLRSEIAGAIAKLDSYSRSIDPVRHPEKIFDPSDPLVIGELIALTLLAQPRQGLLDLFRFYGSGIYAVYYRGDFDAYSPIRSTDHPIYVGKADPKVYEARTAEEQGEKLFVRLQEHLKSVRAAENLDESDFECRYLVVKSAWQGTSESILIHKFRPIWNNETKICFGFGKHGDSPNTRANKVSPWDTLHPGRKWAASEGNVPNLSGKDQILAQIREHFEKHPPILNPQQALAEQALTEQDIIEIESIEKE